MRLENTMPHVGEMLKIIQTTGIMDLGKTTRKNEEYKSGLLIFILIFD